MMLKATGMFATFCQSRKGDAKIPALSLEWNEMTPEAKLPFEVKAKAEQNIMRSTIEDEFRPAVPPLAIEENFEAIGDKAVSLLNAQGINIQANADANRPAA